MSQCVNESSAVQGEKCEKLRMSFPVGSLCQENEDHRSKGSFDWDSRLESGLCGAHRVARFFCLGDV